jgi:hypothetical protein
MVGPVRVTARFGPGRYSSSMGIPRGIGEEIPQAARSRQSKQAEVSLIGKD